MYYYTTGNCTCSEAVKLIVCHIGTSIVRRKGACFRIKAAAIKTAESINIHDSRAIRRHYMTCGETSHNNYKIKASECQYFTYRGSGVGVVKGNCHNK